MSDELPDTKAARVDWVIRAPNNAEMRRRYDIWAQAYDSDVGAVDDYLAPMELAKVAATVLGRGAKIMDAGAGTGLLGTALKERGFQNLVAVDYSDQMLEVARKKSIYRELYTCDLGQPTTFAARSFDAVVTSGTTSQMPSAGLREFVRLVRSGGMIIFAVIPEAWERCGWAAILSELEATGLVTVLSRGAPFQMMPTTEPEFMCEIWVIEVT
jgi:predicted TPR repeat methyltransferase